MKTCLTSVSAKAIGLGAAALVIAFSFGGVRADNADMGTAALQEMLISPLMQAAAEITERVRRVEMTIAAWGTSVVSKEVTAQQLCVADEGGARTCITKAQLDALLIQMGNAKAAQVAQPETSVLAAEAAQEVVQPETVVIIAVEPATEMAQPVIAQTVEPAVTEAEPKQQAAAVARAESSENQMPREEAAAVQIEPVQVEQAATALEPNHIEQAAAIKPEQVEQVVTTVTVQPVQEQPTEAIAARDGLEQESIQAEAKEPVDEVAKDHAIAAVSSAQEADDGAITGNTESTAPASTLAPIEPLSVAPRPEISAPETVPVLD
jgi:hypothetical protein